MFAIIFFFAFFGEIVVSTPEQQLSTFNANEAAYAFYGIATALLAAFLIPFAAGFSRIVRQKSASVSSAAAFLVAALTIVISGNLYVGSLYAISQAPSSKSMMP